MSVEEKVRIFLYTLALGLSNRDVVEMFQRFGETVSRVFHEVLESICGRSKGFMGLACEYIRPKDAKFQGIPPHIQNDSRYIPCFKATGNARGVYVNGLPDYFTESQIRELPEAFRRLQVIDLVNDREMAGQVPGATPAIPGMLQNMFPMASGQFGALPVMPVQAMPGMFQNMFPMASGQFGALPGMPVQAMTQQATRHARRVFVGGLPPSANEQNVAAFFSHVMSTIGGNAAGPGDAVANVYINHEKKFAFLEMRSVEEASNAMALDGIIFEGTPVKVRRPSDYNPSLAAALGPSQPNSNLNLAAVGLSPGSVGGLEGPDCIYVGGLPYYFTEAQVRELLESFGALRHFDLVKDRETGNSKDYAFCVYQDSSVTDMVCAALNGIKMGAKTLTVRRANQG
ncbi:hypothetical protein SSX86_025306 [Deinandra increscens subsp. villosa]|uniref:Splicing factor U2af large subunit n=1 Tax=Deinandra increscens subsp. villosa TaxID=3103831 RepID=A0AAP0CFZ1_9ASTR